MCQFASFFVNPDTFEVKVADLNGHSETARILKLTDGQKPNGWREGHYLPTGEMECRCLDQDTHTSVECRTILLSRWPRFVDFLTWALEQETYVPGSLDLSGLTSAKGLVLPKTVGGYLELSGLTSAKGLVLPKTVGGSLYLRGLTSAKGLVLPKTVGGLELRGSVREELENTK